MFCNAKCSYVLSYLRFKRTALVIYNHFTFAGNAPIDLLSLVIIYGHCGILLGNVAPARHVMQQNQDLITAGIYFSLHD